MRPIETLPPFTAPPPGAFVYNASAHKSLDRCARLWAFQYLLGVGENSEGSEGPQAFGTALHKIAEDFVAARIAPDPFAPQVNAGSKDRPRWLSPSQTFLRGANTLTGIVDGNPHCEAERKFSFEIRGIWYKGTADLEAPGGWGVSDSVHQHHDGTPGYAVPLIVDYKTTSGVRWALTPETLRTDPQFILYAMAVFVANPQVMLVRGLWLYFNKIPRGSEPPFWRVPVEILRSDCEALFAKIVEPNARKMATLSTRVGLPIVDPRIPRKGYPLRNFDHVSNTDRKSVV